MTPWTAARQASLPISNSWSLLKLMSIKSVMPSHHLILCRPILLLPSLFPSIRVFPKESVLRIRWPKYWSFSFSISPSNEYSGLISFRMDWLDLLAGFYLIIYHLSIYLSMIHSSMYLSVCLPCLSIYHLSIAYLSIICPSIFVLTYHLSTYLSFVYLSYSRRKLVILKKVNIYSFLAALGPSSVSAE